MGALLEPLDQPEFAQGVSAGLVAAIAVVVVGVVFRWRLRRPAPVAGLGLAFAATVALDDVLGVPAELVTGVALCALAGLLVDVFDLHPLLLAPASVPGAWTVAGAPGVDAPLGDADLRRTAVLVGIVAGGTLVAAFDRRWRHRAWGPGLLAATVGGVYATVPDTEAALALLGAAVVLAASGWPLRLAHLGAAGSLASVATIAWAVGAHGGLGRDGSVVGALAAVGLLAVDPLVRLAGGHSPLRRLREPLITVVVVVAHVALVLWMTRVAGLRAGAGDALVLVVVGFVVGAVVWAAGGAWSRRARPTAEQGTDVDRVPAGG